MTTANTELEEIYKKIRLLQLELTQTIKELTNAKIKNLTDEITILEEKKTKLSSDIMLAGKRMMELRLQQPKL